MRDIKLYYNNLPKSWAKYTKDNFSISTTKFNEVKEKLMSLNIDNVVIYMQNACKLFVPYLLDKWKVSGIDFIDYFDSVFKENREYDLVETSDYYIIYNVGLEKALNTDFSSKLLIGLIEKINNFEANIVICSHLSYTEFFKKYQIEISNKIQLREKPQKSIF